LNPSTTPDSDLIARLQADGRDAFQEIYKRYWKDLYAVAARKVRSDIAEEIVQDVFVNLWKNRERPIENLKYYLFSAVKYGILNHIKAETVSERYLDFVKIQPQSVDTTAEQNLHLADLNRQIEVVLASLPNKTQTVFSMSRFDYLPVKEIAAQLSLSDKAVEYHLTQALKALRIALNL
jgi:RNA polymerase sigma-70 factor (family 1)